MKLRRLSALAAATALLLQPTSASPVLAAANIQCQGGPGHHTGFQLAAAANVELTAARSTLDKKVAALCLNPGAQGSASMWWIMITAVGNDYIQYGFWNCQSWCNGGWPGGQTGGEQHEFYERNNGNWDGLWRVDLGNVPDGAYAMRMFHKAGTNPHWDFTRDGVLQAQHPDTFRDWPLLGANIQIYSETWDAGDQNGGSFGNNLHMTKAGWGLNHAGIDGVGMGGCHHWPDNNNAWYGCLRYTTTVANDSVRTWTVNR
jgi:3',5'-cyclic AMP phosphodiesterase CpdA